MAFIRCGGGGGSSEIPKFDLIQGTVNNVSEITKGTPTASSSWSGYPPTNAFFTNTGWIASANLSSWTFIFNKPCRVHLLTWSSTDANRFQSPTKYEVSTDGTNFVEVEPILLDKGIMFSLENTWISAFRLTWDGQYGSSYYPMINAMKIYGEEKPIEP